MTLQSTHGRPLAGNVCIVVLSFMLGLLFNYCFFEKVPGISVPLFVLLIIIGLFLLSGHFGKRVSSESRWLLLPLFFFSGMVFVRASILLTFLNVVATILLLLLVAEVSFGRRLLQMVLGDLVRIVVLPVRFVLPLLQTLSSLFLLRGAQQKAQTRLQVVKGIVMAIPVLALFLILFDSADLIFQRYLLTVVHIDFQEETIARTVLVLLVTAAFIGAYSYILHRGEEAPPARAIAGYGVGQIESSILLGAVNVLFFLFILVQVAYLFGGESNISVQGFTYAAYARRGFFELITVAVVSLLLLITLEKYVVRREAGHARGFRAWSVALIVQVLVIMASAFKRLSLYEAAYGFTTLRLYYHAFILFLVVIFCVLLWKILLDRRASAFALRIFIVVNLFLVAMNLLNPDAFIARRNIERYQATGKLDAWYLGQLSADAVPDALRAMNLVVGDMRKVLGQGLYLQTDLDGYTQHWQSFQLSRWWAQKILAPSMEALKSYNPSLP